MKKRVLWICVLIFLGTWLSSGEVHGLEMLDDVDFSALDDTVEETDLPYSGFKEYITAVYTGEEDLSARELLISGAREAVSDLLQEKYLFLQMAALLLILAFLKHTSSGTIASYAVMLSLIWTGVQCFQIPYEITRTLLDRIQTLGQAEIPVLAAITIASGQFTSATLQGELLLSSFTILLQLIRTVFLPLIQSLFLLEAVGSLTGDEWTAGFASLLHTITSKGMKVMTAVLLFLLSVKTQLSGMADQWIKKAATTALSAVPVVGKSLSGAIDTVMSSSLMILKTVGILGFVLLALLCLMPVLKLLILWFFFTAAAALLKPMLQGSSGRLTRGMSNGVSLMIGLMVCILVAYAGMTLVFVMSLKSG